ncbi:hypothetical protein J6590_099055 [Homalodisca vitripennis]|nr:hypothetical protein J6590_099055 [Homalodisca vitripennis]
MNPSQFKVERRQGNEKRRKRNNRSKYWIEYRRDQRALRTRKKDILHSMKFKEEYDEFLIHGHRNEDSENSDTNYTCVMPKPIKKPRIAHPPDVLRTKNTLHLPDIPSPFFKNPL